MTKLYFLGGEDIEKRDSKEIDKKAFADAGRTPVILIFSWTAWFTTSRKNKYRKITKDYFEELGARKIIFAELTDSFREIKKKIESSDLIYLPGGEVNFFVERLKKRKIDSLLKDYKGVIVGNSAGTLALCKRYAVIKGHNDRPKTGLEPGLGLVDFTVSVHYGALIKWDGGISPDKELRKLSRKVKVYAIPERCALVYDGKKLKPMGDVHVFYNGKKMKFK